MITKRQVDLMVAEHVLSWVRRKGKGPHEFCVPYANYRLPSDPGSYEVIGGLYVPLGLLPHYTQDGSAVLALMNQKRGQWGSVTDDGHWFDIISDEHCWVVEVVWGHHDGAVIEGEGRSPDFCLAVCLALLSEAGFPVLEEIGA